MLLLPDVDEYSFTNAADGLQYYENFCRPFWMTSVAQQVQLNDGWPKGLGRKHV